MGQQCNGKAAFATAGQALKRIEAINNHDKREHKKPIRFYQCEVCGLFHLTSQSEGEHKLESESKNPPLDIQEQFEARLKFYGLKKENNNGSK